MDNYVIHEYRTSEGIYRWDYNSLVNLPVILSEEEIREMIQAGGSNGALVIPKESDVSKYEFPQGGVIYCKEEKKLIVVDTISDETKFPTEWHDVCRTLPGSITWEMLSPELQALITKTTALIEKPTVTVSSLEYNDGNEVELPLKSGTGYKVMCYDSDGEEISSIIEVGTYTIKAVLLDGFTWMDNSSLPAEFPLEITKKKIIKPNSTSIVKEWSNQGYDSPIETTIGYKVYFSFNDSEDLTEVTSDTKFIEIGKYEMTTSLDSDHYIWSDGTSDNVTKIFTINYFGVTRPETTSNKTYDGEYTSVSGTSYYTVSVVKTTEIGEVIYIDGSYRTMRAGGYTTTYHLTNEHYAWKDSDGYDPEDDIRDTSISKRPIELTLSDRSKTYDGLPFEDTDLTVTVTSGNWVESDSSNVSYKLSNNIETSKGSREMDFEVIMSEPSLLTDYEITKIKGTYTIANKVIENPTIQNKVYDGTELVVSSGEGYQIKSGSTSEKDAGEYSTVFELIDKENTVWSKSSNSEDYTINWIISKRPITEPTISNTTYSKTDSIFITGNEYYVVVGTSQYKNAGSYDTTFKLIDFSNNAWSKTANAGSETYTISWKIDPLKINLPDEIGDKVYDGTPVSFSGTDDYTVSGNFENIVNKGDYTTIYSLSDKINTVWSSSLNNEDISFEWSITPADSTVKVEGISGLNYESSDKSLVNVSDKPDTTTVYYSLTSLDDAKSKTSSDTPVFTNSGDYTIYWYSEDLYENYTSNEGNVQVSVSKANTNTISFSSLPSDNKINLGNEIDLSVSLTVSEGTTVKYYLDDVEIEVSDSNGYTPTEEGTFTFKAEALNDNYETVSVSQSIEVEEQELPVYWFASNDILYEGDTPTTFAEAMNTDALSDPKSGFVPPVTTNYASGYKLTGTTTSDLGWFIIPTDKVSKIKIVNENQENIEDIFTSTAKTFTDKPEYSICEISYNTEFVNDGTSLYVYYIS